MLTVFVLVLMLVCIIAILSTPPEDYTDFWLNKKLDDLELRKKFKNEKNA